MLSAAEQKEVLAFSEVEMDSLLKGWNADDYTVFSKDFNISGLWLEK